VAELMRQIEMLDKAVEQWKTVEKNLGTTPQLLAKDTKQVLEDAIQAYRKSEEAKIQQEIDAYHKEVSDKTNTELKNLEKKIWETYQDKKSSIITDLIHRLHGGI
jgi:polyribonucleotide nucleotidyltransferase